MSKIELNNEIYIDLEKLVDTRMLVQANSGAGKSWALRRILEQSHGKIQQIILDPEGEFGTLREKYDYILAGKGGDTPANPSSASLLARKLLELNVSAIIDLYELSPQDRKKFVRLFLESMVNAPKELWHPVMVVVDEAHIFVPEKGESEASGAVIDLCTRGRKRGFCAVLATQRISKLHKDAAAECNNKLIGRAGLDIDRKRASEELGFTTKEQSISLRSLESGEFYAFGPAIFNEVIKLQVGGISTSHPKAGSRSLVEIAPPTDKIKKILGELADLPAEAKKEAQTMDTLKAEIYRLKRGMSSQSHVVVKEAFETSLKKAIEPHLIAFRTIENGYKLRIEQWEGHVFGIMEIVNEMTLKLRDFAKRIPKKDPGAKYVETPIKPAYKTSPSSKLLSSEVIRPGEIISSDSNSDLSGPEKRIINAIAQLEAIGNSEPEQTAVAFLSGYTVGGGAFNNPRGSLRIKGMIEYRGNCLVLTDLGREKADIPEKPLTTEELHNKVLSLLPGPERKILEIVLQVYPEGISNEDLAIQSNYSVNGGAFNNPRGRLRSLGLIEYQRGMVRARDILFLN